MKYLVTGSAGFIGGHLVRALEARGDEVVRLDLKDNSGDVRIVDDVMRLAEGVDGIFHLAAIASVQETIKDPQGTFDTNVNGMRHVLAAAQDAGAAVVYASSAAVYGDSQNLPLTEGEDPRPMSPYAEHKLQNEMDAREVSVVYGLKTFGLRFFNVYGAGQDPSSPYSGVISVFYDRLSRGQDLCVYGDGQQTRDFVAVADVVNSLLLAMDNADSSAPVANICTEVQTSLLTLANTLGAVLGADVNVRHEEARGGDIRHSVGSATRFKSLCGFIPSMALEEGLAELVSGA
jgi:UDP-glucose 4-epimerase